MKKQKKSSRYKKKLIVSRQPIFTNLKSNTMKNSAKVRLMRLLCKFFTQKNVAFNTFFCYINYFAMRRWQSTFTISHSLQ